MSEQDWNEMIHRGMVPRGPGDLTQCPVCHRWFDTPCPTCKPPEES